MNHELTVAIIAGAIGGLACVTIGVLLAVLYRQSKRQGRPSDVDRIEEGFPGSGFEKSKSVYSPRVSQIPRTHQWTTFPDPITEGRPKLAINVDTSTDLNSTGQAAYVEPKWKNMKRKPIPRLSRIPLTPRFSRVISAIVPRTPRTPKGTSPRPDAPSDFLQVPSDAPAVPALPSFVGSKNIN